MAATVTYSPEVIIARKALFHEFDADQSGGISADEMANCVEKGLGKTISKEDLDKLIAVFDVNNSGVLEFTEFLDVCHHIEVGDLDGLIAKGTDNLSKGAARVHAGASKGTSHSYSDDEKVAFANHINKVLGEDGDLANVMPLDTSPESDSLFDAVKDGVLLCKLINCAQPGTIDVRAVNKSPKLIFKKNENHNLALDSARAIGCIITNIGADDLNAGTPHLVLGVVWQIIRIGLMAEVSLAEHPGLVKLLEPGEELADFLALPPDQILLRWVNYHLAAAGTDKRIANFGPDVADSVAYLHLLNQLAPAAAPKDDALALEDTHARAEAVIANAAAMDALEFLDSPNDITDGNRKLNLAFVAHVFALYPGLDDEESAAAVAALPELADNEEDERESRQFSVWINSLGLNHEVASLYEDVSDGVILLEIFDAIQPGIVPWKKVYRKDRCNHFLRRIANCNMCIDLANQLEFSTVNVEGNDIVNRNKKLVSGIVWQMMRAYIGMLLSSLASDGHMSDEDMVAWANATCTTEGCNITSFKDSSLASGVFLLELLASVTDDVVNRDDITTGETDDDRRANAKLFISLARKAGVNVFALWEDIVEVKPKMMLAVVGAMMLRFATDNNGAAAAAAPAEDTPAAE